MVLPGVPVDEQLEGFWRLELRAEVYLAETGLLVQGCGKGLEDDGAGVGGLAYGDA